MRILMLVPHPNIQGPIPKIAFHLVAALRVLGCEVATEPWGRHSDHESLLDKIIGRARDIGRIRRTLGRERFDVMVVKTGHDWPSLMRDIPLLLTTRSQTPRIVLQFHGSHPNWLIAPGRRVFKAASAWLLRLSDAALVLSSEEQRHWQQFYPPGKFYVVCNPFLPPENPPSPVGLSSSIGSEQPVLLFVGRMIEPKGIFDLLAAMPYVLQQTLCHLAVAGSGKQAAEVQAVVDRSDLGKHVTLLGYLEEELTAIYRSAAVFVLPTWWNEGFPTVIAEAMSAGLPIVTTRIRGAADHLQSEVNALYIPHHNPTALAEAIIRLLNDPPLRARMGQANREKVKDFAPERVGRHYLDVLEQVMAAK